MRFHPGAVMRAACALGSLAAAVCLATGCGEDRPGPPVYPDTGSDGGGRRPQSLRPDTGPGGFKDVTLPCEGFNYAQLGAEVLTYTVQIHSENTDLTEVLATTERQTAQALAGVLGEYSCEQLLAEDPETVEQQLIAALEQRYRDETGNPGVIDTLSLSIEACE